MTENAMAEISAKLRDLSAEVYVAVESGGDTAP